MAASVDRLEDVPVRRLYSSPPVQMSPKDVDKIGILGKRSRKTDTVVAIPSGFKTVQDSLDDLLVSCHDSPQSGHSISVSLRSTRTCLVVEKNLYYPFSCQWVGP